MADPVDTFTTQEQINAFLSILSEKYLGNNAWVVSSTGSSIVTAAVQAVSPYGNLSNRYFPTVAGLPSVGNNLKTYGELGGYFIPSNLGVSIYLTKSITYSLNSSQIQNNEAYVYTDPTRFNKGRGLTLTDQSNIVSHIINTDWMKSVNTSNVFDGNLINTETYQKFIPYQSIYETTKSDSNGVINARYDFEFWSGDKKQTWTQTNSATKLTIDKYFNLDTKIKDLVLTPGKELYSWQTDIFGNQYGLYKDLYQPRSLYRSLTSTGLLWVKTIDNTINIGPSALHLVYNNYINDYTIYSQLTGNNIINFEIFFDTLVIQLSSTVLYEKITFNYLDYSIEKSLQNFSPLTYGNTDSNALNIKGINAIGIVGNPATTFFGGNWYNAENKTITICTILSAVLSGGIGSIIDTGGVSGLIVPVLYEINLNSPQERTRIYPTNNTNVSNFIEYVYPLTGDSGNGISYMEAPVFCYNEDTKLFLTSFIAFSGTSQQAKIITYKIAL